MTTEQQELWLRAASDALEGIRPIEIREISAELRRSVTRHNQIVPEISKLVAEKRARANRVVSAPASREWEITNEAQLRRGKAKTRDEIEAAWQWERDARLAANLDVPPLEPPLTRREIANLTPSLVKMGLSCGALKERDGQIVNA